MKPTVALQLALAGNRTDSARVTLTALSVALATVAGLAALTVLAIPTPPGGPGNNDSAQYANALLREPGLRGGTAIALLLLTIPVLTLAGQCVRLGAPARDRRLAGLRLAGATPGQVTRLVVLETGLASLVGTLVGLAVYLIGRVPLDQPDARGRLPLPTDVLPSPVAIGAVVLGLPVLTGLVGAVLLRGVSATPFGVLRRTREHAPGPWAWVLLVAGLATFASFGRVLDWFTVRHREPPVLLPPLLIAGGATAAMVGVVLSSGWFSYTAGRLLHRYARRPAALLASRRLTTDPWAGSRTFAALLMAVLVGAGAAGLRASVHADIAVDRLTFQESNPNNAFYLRSIDLVDLAVGVAVAIAAGGLLVALVDGIVARRRAYAALVATGVPRATIGRAIAWQAIAPAVPAIGLALVVGFLLSRAVGGRPATGGGHSTMVCDAARSVCDDPVARRPYLRLVEVPEVAVPPGVPVAQLAWIGAGALVAVLVTVAVGLLFLRASTELEELRAT
ncbi:FtsX-like permease family protein [Micromonospora sp. NPDC092111]|uniref:FtsX-like permease family protein n=1 Tax=Micromonospora sp. NPDC092111 TaxID=3364289 RepID=UPI00381A4E71